MKLLEETIRELKGEDLEDDVRAAVNLQVDLRIDESYIARHEPAAGDLPADRRGAHGATTIGRVLDEVRDRYGAAARSVLNLADVRPDPGAGRSPRARSHRPRRLARRLQVQGQDAAVDPARGCSAWSSGRPDLQLVPPAVLRLDLSRRPVAAPTLRQASAAGGARPARRQIGATGRRPRPSWWTARATAGEVAPGFTKARSSPSRPMTRGPPDGLFDRVLWAAD